MVSTLNVTSLTKAFLSLTASLSGPNNRCGLINKVRRLIGTSSLSYISLPFIFVGRMNNRIRYSEARIHSFSPSLSLSLFAFSFSFFLYIYMQWKFSLKPDSSAHLCFAVADVAAETAAAVTAR